MIRQRAQSVPPDDLARLSEHSDPCFQLGLHTFRCCSPREDKGLLRATGYHFTLDTASATAKPPLSHRCAQSSCRSPQRKPLDSDPGTAAAWRYTPCRFPREQSCFPTQWATRTSQVSVSVPLHLALGFCSLDDPLRLSTDCSFA